ncbi:protein deadlock-like [Drosophila guanche]|uniref:Blast:Protein deadlock n=1 Tax=Drosophila guanche TaxID=7266 RepID=A0A3B0KQ08_DROGU|nr:protein deadlock-like [Drosophila guanche]SPP88699.1 blast:Protein deadlock [Drosophila guanche]
MKSAGLRDIFLGMPDYQISVDDIDIDIDLDEMEDMDDMDEYEEYLVPEHVPAEANEPPADAPIEPSDPMLILPEDVEYDFEINLNDSSSMIALFGVKCTDNINEGCTKSNCDHSLESVESVKSQLMVMQPRAVLQVYHQMFYHGILAQKYHQLFFDVFHLRGFMNTTDRNETVIGDYW